MPNGEIPVHGSATTGTGSDATFPIEVTKVNPDDIDLLTIRTKGKPLHIFVDNGQGTKFHANLFPGWEFEIREKKAGE